MSQNERPYTTTDLSLGAFLHCHGVELLRIEHDGRKAAFVFEDSGACKDLALKFYNGKTTCDARGYVRSLKELKAAIFNV